MQGRANMNATTHWEDGAVHPPAWSTDRLSSLLCYFLAASRGLHACSTFPNQYILF